MIKKFLIILKTKTNINLMHINNSQYYGVIGWLADDRKQSVKGEDHWKREGQLKK